MIALQPVPTSLRPHEGQPSTTQLAIGPCPKAAASVSQQYALLHQSQPQVQYTTAHAVPAMLHAKVLLHHGDAEFRVTLASVCVGV